MKIIQQIEEDIGFEEIVQQMFKSADRLKCAQKILIPFIEKTVSEREIVMLPDEQKFLQAVGSVLEEIG